MSLYAIGQVLTGFGIRGTLKIKPLTHTVERFAHLRQVFLGRSEEDAKKMTVENVEFTPKAVHLTLAEIAQREEAVALNGQFVFVEEADVEPPPKGLYFIHDIVGCDVWIEGTKKGTVIEVLTAAQGLAQDIWVIRTDSGERWIPAAKEFIEMVDVAARKIVIRPIVGLLEP